MPLASFEVARKFVHLSGSLIPLSYLFLDPTKLQALLILGGIAFPFVAADFLRLKWPAANQWFQHWFRVAMRPGEEDRPTGAAYYFLACWLTILLFERTVAVAALLILAYADTAASVVGQALGGYRLAKGKTLSGSAAFLVTTFLVALPFFSPSTALGGALIVTVAECLPLPLDDNVTIPLVAGIFFTLVHPL